MRIKLSLLLSFLLVFWSFSSNGQDSIALDVLKKINLRFKEENKFLVVGKIEAFQGKSFSGKPYDVQNFSLAVYEKSTTLSIGPIIMTQDAKVSVRVDKEDQRVLIMENLSGKDLSEKKNEIISFIKTMDISNFEATKFNIKVVNSNLSILTLEQSQGYIKYYYNPSDFVVSKIETIGKLPGYEGVFGIRYLYEYSFDSEKIKKAITPVSEVVRWNGKGKSRALELVGGFKNYQIIK
jgi:hypothetical protein